MSVTITPENYTPEPGYLPRIAWRVVVGSYDSGIVAWAPITAPAGSTTITVYTTGNVMIENNNWITTDGHGYQYNENANNDNGPSLIDLGEASAAWPWIIGGAVVVGVVVLLWKRKKTRGNVNK